MSLLKRRVRIPTRRNPDATYSIGSLLIIVVALVVAVSCICCVGWTVVDQGLRSAGILPTRTATPTMTPTATATKTATPRPMDTAIPPTATPVPTDTAVPPTATPVPTATQLPTPTPTITRVPATPTPESTASLVPTGARVRIVAVNKMTEFVDIRNDGDQAQDLGGWRLVSEKGNQACPLGGTLGPGETLRIWALSKDTGQGGYNCGFGDTIWNNSEADPAVLYDAAGVEVDRF